MKTPPIPGENPSTLPTIKTPREAHLEHRAEKTLGESRNRFLADMMATGTVTRADALGRWLNLVRRECGIVENEVAQRVFPSLEKFRPPRRD